MITAYRCPDIDLKELQRVTKYDGGYSADSPAVQWFWHFLFSLDEPTKRQFLQFVTGCERVPVGGLARLSPQFVIMKNGGQSDRLPTSHTCFHALLLPEYTSKEYLADRMSLALKNAHGFGLR
jgi:hypothetical protein